MLQFNQLTNTYDDNANVDSLTNIESISTPYSEGYEAIE